MEQRAVAGDRVDESGVLAEFLALAAECLGFLVEPGERLFLMPRRHTFRGGGEMRGGLTIAQTGQCDLAPLAAGDCGFQSETIAGGFLELLDFGEEGVCLIEMPGLEGFASPRS